MFQKILSLNSDYRRFWYGFLAFLLAISIGITNIQPSYGFSWLELMIRGVQIVQLSNISNAQEVELAKGINQKIVDSGQAKIFNSGDFKQAIMASCAIPLVFHPIKIEDELYVDGGLLNNLPTEPLVNHCDLVIGVSSVAKAPFPQKNLTNMIDIGLRIFNIVEAHSVEVKRPACDLIIEAEGLATYNIFNFNLVDELVEIGYQASKAKVGELRELLDRNDVEII